MKAILAMLDECASGHERDSNYGPHKKLRIYLGNRDFVLTAGRKSRKAKSRAEIERGDVKKMVRHLRLGTEDELGKFTPSDCVKRMLPSLY